MSVEIDTLLIQRAREAAEDEDLKAHHPSESGFRVLPIREPYAYLRLVVFESSKEGSMNSERYRVNRQLIRSDQRYRPIAELTSHFNGTPTFVVEPNPTPLS